MYSKSKKENPILKSQQDEKEETLNERQRNMF